MSLEEIGKRIQEYRRYAGMTQQNLAEKLEISVGHLSAIERGVKIPSMETFILIANAIEAPAESLLQDVIKYKELNEKDYLKQIEILMPKDRKRIKSIIEIFLNENEN